MEWWQTEKATSPTTALGGGSSYPPPGWPTADQVEYTREIILLGLLLIALPWLISTLASRPEAIFLGKKSVRPPKPTLL